MDEHDLLAERFEQNRAQLCAVAYRMLGSRSEAEDAVQESWLRLSRSDAGEIDNLGGWLTTVTARVCLNMLQSRKTRREDLVGARLPEPVDGREDGGTPEREAVLADSVGSALLIVLETLTPAERLAFVLHDLFAVSFDEIAPIVGRSSTAARQLASRARRRVQAGNATPDADLGRQRKIVDAFLAASRSGDFEALLVVLDPDVVLRADDVAVRLATAKVDAGAPRLARELRGPDAVLNTFAGRAKDTIPATVDGAAGAAWAPGGKPRSVFSFTVLHGRITAIEIIADPQAIAELEVTLE